MSLLRIGLTGASIGLLALTLATQVFAAVHHQHAALGLPVLTLGSLKFYAPWQFVQWLRWWGRPHPELFLWAGIAFGGSLLLMGSVWVAAALGAFQQRGDVTLATREQLRKAGLLRKDGIVIGKQP